MGTGIVATALPSHFTALRPLATAVWLLASVMLVGLAFTWRNRPFDPASSPFLGAPPMALLTVGAGTLVYGRDLIGLPAAIAVDAVLWTAGTLLGLATLIGVPRLMITRHRLRLEEVSGAWLMPVVPPMVAATCGAYLVPHAGSLRTALVITCYALYGLSLLVVIPILVGLVCRIRAHGPGPATLVPTLLIVLGPLGQSVTAVNLLGRLVPEMAAFGLWYGVPVLTLALIWLAVSAFFLLRTARRGGLPFAMTWWSFTFPVGTCVTGAAALAVQLDSELFGRIGLGLYALLVSAWLTVMFRTVPLVVPQLRDLRTRPEPVPASRDAGPADTGGHGAVPAAAEPVGERRIRTRDHLAVASPAARELRNPRTGRARPAEARVSPVARPGTFHRTISAGSGGPAGARRQAANGRAATRNPWGSRGPRRSSPSSGT
ncbi:TDT family transporter [Streptosporangium fragile]|uniref:TDT family transporter n=2 Tax=Streptosporangium fragile TaxID=46186 RepID=A0ABP6IK00_9ACTN